ncbi:MULTISPECIES: DUF2235 domain-containing protein [unclassified Acinetobacter]|uniref:T6SS phospholipase effector Tle1-like catalytic domain-containing protein n=1 Tax=unclassified Acinetobacter TaxID=196816 RepID=UPI0015D28110|nr:MULTISPECIES: DUF2235 domain-containing protein [unclassified Acinetobacter]UUS65330.1 DUF2235 domain-containing protein [Acinetobacter sp. YH12068_T]
MSEINRVIETNSDVPNNEPTAKQDCSDVVHISVFFDGTGNNKDKDSDKKKWSNPARLWRNARTFIDSQKGDCSNYAIYASGVGTRFNADLNFFQRAISVLQDHLGLGAGLGLGGARRLDYSEEQLNDALKQVMIFNAQKAEIDVSKYVNEKKDYSFAEIAKSLDEHRLIKKINISTFGFSRGAALARAFTNQFMWQCESSCDGLTYGTGKYPIEFKFMGIFDTVASFGLPAANLNNNITFKGRDMVIDERVKMCVHHVAGNELRFAFPVDLIHKKNGEISNSNWKELVYPGMHSDVGGGYTPGSQNVNDNFARIPLKDMLQEATNAGVRMLSYEELEKDHSQLFEQQFEIKEETQRLYNAVKDKISNAGSIEEQIISFMKVYYSAYGTLSRNNVDSVSENARKGIGNKVKDTLMFWSPRDMATEMDRLQALRNGAGIFKVTSPVSESYEYLINMENWILESWNEPAHEDVTKFYSDFVHDSKYGFLFNAEPFSYFRQRTVYESRRSDQGKEIDKKLSEEKAVCEINADDIPQEEFIDSYESAVASNYEIAS